MRIPVAIWFIAIGWSLSAQRIAPRDIEFVPNGGQWPGQVEFRASFHGGVAFLEKDRFTFTMCDNEPVARFHDLYHYQHDRYEWASLKADCHAYQVVFRDANPDVRVISGNPMSHYYNYFIGNNPARWASNLHPSNEVWYEGIYPGIDLVVHGAGGNLKYDFVLSPGADPHHIRLVYEGQDELSIRNGNVIIATSVGELQELTPIAYQRINERQVMVECHYRLNGNTLSFDFPHGYDVNHVLVIDPTLIASTYSGSSGNETVEGFVAAYDSSGNILAAGICYQNGYPVTIGAYQTIATAVYNVAISKFNQDASSLLWATYLGGVGRENILSMTSDSDNNVVVLGSTMATDFPTTANAHDTSFNGGDYDLFLTVLSQGGSALLASTFIGGAEDDGINDITYNTEDRLRGTLLVDADDNCYVTTCTKSSDFPTTPGAVQPSPGGQQDAVVFKMSKSLDTLLWSSYLGGTGLDVGYSLGVDPMGNVFVVGSTESADFPTTGGTVNSSYLGNHDGFIAKLNNAGTALLKVCFAGTPGFLDQASYIDFDSNGDVFVYGQSNGNMPVTPGTYSNPNSGLYVQKYDPDLSNLLASTVFGSGSGFPDLVPAGLLVDTSDYIYATGFEKKSSHAPIPTTFDAFQPVPNSNQPDSTNFFFIVFDKDLSDTLYATYIGSRSYDHTHSPGSRYDKRGFIYQGVCNFDGLFPIMPWSVAPNKPSSNTHSDMVVFKFQIQDATLHPPTGMPAQTEVAPSLRLLPNPTDHSCVVSINNAPIGAGELQLLTLVGSVISVHAFGSSKTPAPVTLDLSDLQAGLYLLRLVAETWSTSARIVKL